MKKLIIIITLFMSLTIKVQAEEYKEFPDENSFKQYVLSLNKNLTSDSGLEINFKVYKQYHIIAYGEPFGRWKSDEEDGKWKNGTWTGEYEYLGYNEKDYKIGNSIYPHDELTNNFPYDTNFIPVPGALESWKNLTKEQIDYMLTSELIYLEIGPGKLKGFTLESIGGKEYARVVVAPTWRTAGNVLLMNNGSK